MKPHISEIIEGVGLGNLKFGMTRDQAQFVLGAPDEKEKYNYTDEEKEMTEDWHYDELELSIAFDEDDDWRLTVIAINAPDYTFKGFSPVGMSKEALTAKLGELGIQDLQHETWATDDSPSHELLSSEELSINFWFDEDALSEVQWGPHFTDEDTIKWPE